MFYLNTASPDIMPPGTDADSDEEENCFAKRVKAQKLPKPLYDRSSNFYYTHPLKIDVFLSRSRNPEKSAICIGFDVGTEHGTRKWIGVAHLAEHMLMKGDKEFFKFVMENTGSSNALTNPNLSALFFEISSAQAIEALTNFIGILARRQIKEHALLSELQAIEEEYIGFVTVPDQQIFNIIGHLANPQSRYHGLEAGNMQTLGFPGITTAVRDFVNTYYVPALMTVAIYGSYQFANPDVIDPILDLLPRSEAPRTDPGTTPPFYEEQMKRLVRVAGLAVPYALQIMLLFRDNLKRLSTRLRSILERLLTTSEEGGLLSELRRRRITVQLYVTDHRVGHFYNYLFIHLQLPPEDLSRHEEIIFVVGEYLDFIRGSMSKDIYDEVRNVERVREEIEDALEPLEHVRNIVDKNDYLSPGRVLVGPPDAEYSAQDMGLMLKYVSLNHAMVFVATDEEEEFDQTVTHLGTRFSTAPLTVATRFAKPTSFRLKPGAWRGIPFADLERRTSELRAVTQSSPVAPRAIALAKYGRRAALYYQPIGDYALPLFMLNLGIYLDASSIEGTKGVALQAMYFELLNDALRTTSSRLKAVNVTLELYPERLIHMLQLRGVSPALDTAFTAVARDLAAFRATVIDQTVFETARKKAQQSLIIAHHAESHIFMNKMSKAVLLKDECTLNETQGALNALLLEDFQTFVKTTHEKLFLEGLITGDLDASKAESCFTQLADALMSDLTQTCHIKRLRPVSLAKSAGIVLPYPELEGNACMIALYYYIGSGNKARAFGDLAESALFFPFFDEIRDKQQLGYHVYMKTQVESGHSYIGFFIQSANIAPSQCLRAALAFVESVAAQVKHLCALDFKRYQKSAKTKYLNKPINFYNHHRVLYTQLIQGDRRFTQMQVMPGEIAAIGIEKYKKMFDEHFVKNPKCVHIHLVNPLLIEETQKKVNTAMGSAQNIYTSLEEFHQDRTGFDDLWRFE